MSADRAVLLASYAETCLNVAKALPDREVRVVLREMAAEWLLLADQAARSNLILGILPDSGAPPHIRSVG